MVYKLVKTSFAFRPKDNNVKLSRAGVLSLVMIWSTLASIASFIVTNHYYAVDARYLTISLFTVFIAAATYLRTKQWRPGVIISAGLVIAVGIIVGLLSVNRVYFNPDNQALASLNSRNQKINQILSEHHVNVLLGDYWRVLPIRLGSQNQLNVMPLQNCTTPRQTLSSSAWQPDLNNTSFAYLITISGSLTDYPSCSLSQVLSVYRRPNITTLVAGTLTNPKELLLFYDQGIPKVSASQSPRPVTTIAPINLSDLTNTVCSVPTVMNIVAHQDDDLLFMNPQVIKDIDAGYCVRSVYITAGNDGEQSPYWIGREEGSETAYSYMLNSSSVWLQKTVELNSHEFITVASSRGNNKISLIFVLLPDGNLEGQGFSSSNYESLAKLNAGTIKVINSVDGQSYYGPGDLINALSSLMSTYRVTEINTQSEFTGTRFTDHSDHNTTGFFATLAYKLYETQQYDNLVTLPITYYLGYPVHELTPNLSGPLLQEKEAAFIKYAAYDGHVCQSLSACLRTPTYAAYLTSEYTYPD